MILPLFLAFLQNKIDHSKNIKTAKKEVISYDLPSMTNKLAVSFFSKANKIVLKGRPRTDNLGIKKPIEVYTSDNRL